MVDRASLPAQLKWYYSRLFPLELIGKWLSYGDATMLAKREVSFTLEGDIYLRYRSFDTPAALGAELGKLTPIKMDFGAVHNIRPRDKGASALPLTPAEKELVFDIDMTDYQDVMGALRDPDPTAETDVNWAYMATAVRIIDTALAEDFGFRHRLWVYSGRRGVHCWVADARARRLSNESRGAVAEFLGLRFEERANLGGRRATDITAPLHPSLARARREACEPTFLNFVLGEQRLLDPNGGDTAGVLAHIPDRGLRAGLAGVLSRGPLATAAGVDRWARIEKELARAAKADPSLRSVSDHIVLRYTYPRLDIPVTRDVGHLLKAPFCVHPKTGRVCVPFDAATVDSFDPRERVPTLAALMDEMDGAAAAAAAAATTTGAGAGGGGRATGLLEDGKRVLRRFVEGLEAERASIAAAAARKRRLEEVDASGAMAFAAV
ncbi:hypothetical protein MMPV_004634 [Pyropia vietnamensis]